MPKTHPLAEIFGFPPDNQTAEAKRHRGKKLCPFNNKVPNCTKDKANDPLGVCSVFEKEALAITCPIRFRQNWIIADDAAEFFFPKDAKWTSLTEVRLKDKNDKSAGNIDLVLVSYNDRGKVTDFRVPGDRREVSLTLLMDFRSERRKTSGNLGRTWRRECLRLGPQRRVSNPRNEPSSFDSGLTRPDAPRFR